ncbi:surface-adhesin E family protein [Methylobacter svalbardensis]|uniref:surface-adhesin E family protein n=1 Tax=Methylobacter svalbardensis TaxID=3080016 RepID=UPI0030EB539C
MRLLDGSLTTYVDTDTHKKGSNVTILVLYDFTDIHSGPHYEKYLSAFYSQEYDCENEQVKILNEKLFSGNMAKGKMIASPTMDNKWIAVEPKTISDWIWKIACTKKWTKN